MTVLRCLVIGKANAASEEVGRLRLMELFGEVRGPDTATGETLDEYAVRVGETYNYHLPYGRDANDEPLYIDVEDNPMYESQIITPGVFVVDGQSNSGGGSYTPPLEADYQIGGVKCNMRSETVAGNVHASPLFFVLAVKCLYPEDSQPAGWEDREWSDPFTSADWTELRDGLVAQWPGLATPLDDWWSANSGESRATFAKWLKDWLVAEQGEGASGGNEES